MLSCRLLVVGHIVGARDIFRAFLKTLDATEGEETLETKANSALRTISTLVSLDQRDETRERSAVQQLSAALQVRRPRSVEPGRSP